MNKRAVLIAVVTVAMVVMWMRRPHPRDASNADAQSFITTAEAQTTVTGSGGVSFPLVAPNGTCATPAFGNGGSSGFDISSGSVAMLCNGGSRVFGATTATTIAQKSSGIFCWTSSATDPTSQACDTAFTRINPGIVALGTGAAGNTAGTLQLSKLSFKADGAHLETNTANKDIAGTATFVATTVTVTFTTAYTSAPACQATDQTAAAPVRAAPTTSNVVFTGGTGAGTTDVIAYACFGNPN